MLQHNDLYKRQYVVALVAIAIVVTFIVRLYGLQIKDTSAQEKAENISLVKQTVFPERGLIYDRNGKLLVFNQPFFEVMMVTRDMNPKDEAPFDTLGFCQVMKIDTATFNRRLKEMKNTLGYSKYRPQLFMTQLSAVDIAPLEEALFRFPGISIQKRNLRNYSYDCAAHVLGSIGEVNQSDIDKDSYYRPGDYSGRNGVERTYEKELRGQKGVSILMRDIRGCIQGPYKNGEEDSQPIAGHDLTITLDIELQQLAEYLLDKKIASVVAIEPSTGEVLTMASNPSWDPALLVGRQRAHYYNLLDKNADTHPLLNRATQAQYSPGSTFKTLQSLVCLQEHGISPGTCYICNGPGSAPIKCTHHHATPTNLLTAIEQSCNPYFWQAYRDMLEKDGYGKNNENFRKRYQLWVDDVKSFNLGRKFEDSDIAGQSAGSVPSVALYDRIYGATGWRAMTIRSNSIGQGEVLVTPLQLANLAATIANGGYYISPHLNKNDSMLTHRHETVVESKYFELVRKGMGRVMTNGTGRRFQIPGIESGGKTGTVQNGKKANHAIFIGFAPLDDPKIAVAVVVENAGYGATWAAPIASLIMEQYLTGTITRADLKENTHNQTSNAKATKLKK